MKMPLPRRASIAFVVMFVILCLPLLGWAQGRRRPPQTIAENVAYDGRFTFARIRFDQVSSGGFGRGDVKWAHDYPRGERHFTKIVGEISSIRSRTLVSNIFALDDPELSKFPVAYLCEAGYWQPSDAEVVGLRNYLMKGGFIIFDDFAGEHWLNFESQMLRVLPKAKFVPLTIAHPIFDSFYRIKHLDYEHPYYRGLKSVFYGIFEDNDPNKRLVAIINYNNDMSEYWEFSDEGMFPLDMSNEAYKLGVNYIIYALTR